MDFLSKITQKEVDRIESYLCQLMKDTERTEFENELAVNPKLKQQTQAIKTMMDEMEETVFRSKIKDFHAQLPATGKVRTLYTKWMWTVIAAAAVFAFLFLWNPKSTYEKIYDKYFYLDPGLPTPMSSHQNYAFNEAMVDYKQENYAIAIEKWLLLLNESPENDTLNYFLGAAYLAEGQTSEAVVYLDKIEKEQNSVFQKDAAYYQALLHLKNKNPESAVNSLKNAPSNKNRQLLNEIESAKK